MTTCLARGWEWGWGWRWRYDVKVFLFGCEAGRWLPYGVSRVSRLWPVRILRCLPLVISLGSPIGGSALERSVGTASSNGTVLASRKRGIQ